MWCNTSSKVNHIDLWIQILDFTEQLGDEVKWIHVPSHIGIKGNAGGSPRQCGMATDPTVVWAHIHMPHLAGQEKPPLIQGRIAVGVRRNCEAPITHTCIGPANRCRTKHQQVAIHDTLEPESRLAKLQTQMCFHIVLDERDAAAATDTSMACANLREARKERPSLHNLEYSRGHSRWCLPWHTLLGMVKQFSEPPVNNISQQLSDNNDIPRAQCNIAGK